MSSDVTLVLGALEMQIQSGQILAHLSQIETVGLTHNHQVVHWPFQAPLSLAFVYTICYLRVNVSSYTPIFTSLGAAQLGSPAQEECCSSLHVCNWAES